VYFEWKGPSGLHVLTGMWRAPDGRVVEVSPDVKIESKTSDLTCYWNYTIDPKMRPGVWSLEVRIDGQPAGSHSFEIAGTHELPVENRPQLPTLDEMFKRAQPSLAWVRKLNSQGRPVDTAIGFVVAKGRLLTALQAIDGAAKVEIEFSDGRTVRTDQVVAWSRPGDWAEMACDTGGSKPFVFGDPSRVVVGDRLITFNVDAGAITIGGVDVSARRNVPDFGARIQISPNLPLESAGAPVLDARGDVVGILGGSLLPGLRYAGRKLISNPALRGSADALSAISPLGGLPPSGAGGPSTLGELLTSGVLTEGVTELDEMIYAIPARNPTKSASEPLPPPVTEFTVADKSIWIISEWQRKGKESKGLVSAKVYDSQNRVRVKVDPKKTSLSSDPMRVLFPVAPSQLGAGLFRVDLLWNGQPVWRAFITIRD
jgi:hypothetical protein